MENELKPKVYKRNHGEVTPMKGHELDTLIEMSIEKLGHRPPKYGIDELPRFKQDCIDFFRYVEKVNDGKEYDYKLIPDNEALLTYLNISRQTWLNYKRRNDEWNQFCESVSTCLVACKKQMLFKNRIPGIVGMFDLVNNTDTYRNTSEFKLTTETGNKFDEVEHMSSSAIAEKYRGLIPQNDSLVQNDVLANIDIVKDYSE